MNILFICSRNQWRSPTAEQVWKNRPGVAVRSAGTSPQSRRTINHRDVAWADIIFVMEQTHKKRLTSQFQPSLNETTIYVLDIPDEYQFMDPELIEMIDISVTSYLTHYCKV